MSPVATIAIVDDDVFVGEALVELIETFDCRGVWFGDAEAFLEALQAQRFDGLLSDIRMPRIDGFALRSRVSVIAPQLPVIFISSCDDAVTRARAVQAGVVDFLAKPVRPEILWAAMAAGFGLG